MAAAFREERGTEAEQGREGVYFLINIFRGLLNIIQHLQHP
jgi:hypothetical protein